MYLHSCKIENFMAFRSTDTIEFEPGFNIIVGKNGVGKSSLLRVLKFDLPNQPHRSSATVPNRNITSTQPSSAVITYAASKEDIKRLLASATSFWIPRSAAQEPEYVIKALEDWQKVEEQVLIPYSLPKSTSNVEDFLNLTNRQGTGKKVFYDEYIRSKDGTYAVRDRNEDRRNVVGAKETIESLVLKELTGRRYAFHAERPNLGKSQAGPETQLQPNASNLPQVLQVLQGNHHRYKRYNQYVSKVLPNIKWVEARPVGTSLVEIYIWLEDPADERNDLAIPLADCGTGVGQVLAMLYVVFTAETPMTIIIDEPQSFLHPSAIHSLISVFREYKDHQYIIATHSPTVLSAARPCRIIQIAQSGTEAVIRQSESNEVEDVRAALHELGVRLADTFGADNILWVEGQTEEICFPKLLEDLLCFDMAGTKILSVANTGDFQQNSRKGVELVFSVYNRLSTTNAIFPPAIGFLFDREGLSEEDVADLQKRSARPVTVLKRRMYECYLLDPDAITAVMNAELAPEQQVNVEDVHMWLRENKTQPAYLPDNLRSVSSIPDDKWYENVNAAKLLKDMFNTLRPQQLEYRKTHHSVALTSWLIEHKSESMMDLANSIRDFLVNSRQSLM